MAVDDPARCPQSLRPQLIWVTSVAQRPLLQKVLLRLRAVQRPRLGLALQQLEFAPVLRDLDDGLTLDELIELFPAQ